MDLPAGVALLDSVTEVTVAHGGMVVVTGSHGGPSAGRYALAVRTHLYVFNDAGVGKDAAGIVALAMLQEIGQPDLDHVLAEFIRTHTLGRKRSS